MIRFQPGSHLYRLVTCLSVAGELPTSGLYLIGNERVVKALVHDLTMRQTIENTETGQEMTCRLFGISGKGKLKTLRFYHAGLPILDWLHPSARQYYMDTFSDHRFPGNDTHKDRNHRVAETVMMCMRAGLEIRPYVLPLLQMSGFITVAPGHPVYYGSRAVKSVMDNSMDKLAYSRVTGTILGRQVCLPIYNTRNAVMKWNGSSEFKAKMGMEGIGRMNAGVRELRTALLLGHSYDVALRTLEETAKRTNKDFRLDSVYPYIRFIPQSDFGIRQLKLLSVPDIREQLLQMLFRPEDRSYDSGSFTYDAIVDGRYTFSFLDGDICSLDRFRSAIEDRSDPPRVVCFPEQVDFVRAFLHDRTYISTVEIDEILENL